MIDITVEKATLTPCLHIMSLLQCIKQSCWPEDSSLLTLPGIESYMIDSIINEVFIYDIFDGSPSLLHIC